MDATLSSMTLPGPSRPANLAELRSGPATVVYDGACPFCTAYSKLVQLRQSVGAVRLLNARELAPSLIEELRTAYNLDDGMLFIHDSKIYYGNEAVNRIAILSSDSNFLRRVSSSALKSPRVAALLYPLLRFGRNTAIWLRGAGHIHR